MESKKSSQLIEPSIVQRESRIYSTPPQLENLGMCEETSSVSSSSSSRVSVAQLHNRFDLSNVS